MRKHNTDWIVYNAALRDHWARKHGLVLRREEHNVLQGQLPDRGLVRAAAQDELRADEPTAVGHVCNEASALLHQAQYSLLSIDPLELARTQYNLRVGA